MPLKKEHVWCERPLGHSRQDRIFNRREVRRCDADIRARDDARRSRNAVLTHRRADAARHLEELCAYTEKMIAGLESAEGARAALANAA
jgi:hypothetical protein